MYLAYADESGDSGYVNSPTSWFVLACLLVHETDWKETLDQLIEMRKQLRSDFGIPVRAEIKSTNFIYRRGALTGIGRRDRIQLFRELLRIQGDRLAVKSFAIAIAKDRIKDRSFDPRDFAWTYLLQRLDKFCENQEPKERVMVLPDSGHIDLVRRITRKVRRFQRISGHYGAHLEIPARHIIEDPFDKDSKESYFTQLVDWNAYVAHRYKGIAPTAKTPSDLWDELKDKRLLEVNALTGGLPGIVVWPRT